VSIEIRPLSELVTEVVPGFASGVHNAAGNGIPHLRPMNIGTDGKISLETVKSVSSEVNSKRLAQGDVLFNNTNSADLVGKTALIDFEADLAFSNHMTRIRVREQLIVPVYLASFLHSKWMDGTFKKLCSNHVNQASISRAALQSLLVPVPPLDEQKRIVSQLEDQLGKLDEVKARLTASQQLLDSVRSSILHRAFLAPEEAV